jgi:hypothetical protein
LILNDRIFQLQTNCFLHLGHINQSSQKHDYKKLLNKKPEVEIPREGNNNQNTPDRKLIEEDFVLGDDPGSSFLVNLLTRLEFTDIPFLRKYKVRPFIFGEMVCYPPYGPKNTF